MEYYDIVQMVVNVGMSPVIIGYLLYKDYKQTDKMITALQELTKTCDTIKTFILKADHTSEYDDGNKERTK